MGFELDFRGAIESGIAVLLFMLLSMLLLDFCLAKTAAEPYAKY